MTADLDFSDHARSAAARFFIRIGQVGRATEDHDRTLPLFPLPLILDCEGVLSSDARHLL